jgi:hypothetical protein
MNTMIELTLSREMSTLLQIVLLGGGVWVALAGIVTGWYKSAQLATPFERLLWALVAVFGVLILAGLTVPIVWLLLAIGTT